MVNDAASAETTRVLSERLTGIRAAREIIQTNPDHSIRWAEHDYPSPVARWNYHPELEIHLIRKGSGRFIVGDFVGTFQAGHVSLIGSGLPHDWVSDLAEGEVIPSRDVVIQIDPEWIEICSKLMPELRELDHLIGACARGIEFTGGTAKDAERAIELLGRETGLARLRGLFDLLTLLARSPRLDQRTLATEFFRPDLDSRAAVVVDIVLEYVFTEHQGSISMSRAAELSGMSASNFSRYFKNATGQNFSDLVRKLRVAHASRLLRDSEISVAGICFEVGFANLSNFNRQFRREIGQSPREYRKTFDRPAGRATT